MPQKKTKLRRACALASFAFLFAGCTITHPQPRWINAPAVGTAVGCSDQHADGRAAQEELALTRAQASFGARLGVTVKSTIVVVESHKGAEHHDGTVGKSTAESVTHAEGENIVAVEVRKSWRDPVTGRYCVLVDEV